MPSPFRAGSRYTRCLQDPDTAEAPAKPLRTAGSSASTAVTTKQPWSVGLDKGGALADVVGRARQDRRWRHRG
jgi:hypothetical protein